MGVIGEFAVVDEEFGLSRLLAEVPGVQVELEAIVPVSDQVTPLLWVYDDHQNRFEERVVDSPVVESVHAIETFEDRSLYVIEWAIAPDSVLNYIAGHNGFLLSARGSATGWHLELRFPTHDDLTVFQQALRDDDVSFVIERIYSPNGPKDGIWFGLTDAQREALLLAIERGYYAIPRECSTVDLADELGISDQAVLERLRRAIVALVENTLLTVPT